MNRAAVPIPEKLFFKIGEVCDITDVQAHVLRYWESEFPMLAPQKNRAGQRTYRKRDVEMVLRIKELLYEDQYTIAGAKKKLTGDLRSASKLKVVTPEMSAAAQQQQQQNIAPVPTPQSETQTAAPPPPPASAALSLPTPPPRANFEENVANDDAQPLLTEERRTALRRLQRDLRDLLSLLDAGDAKAGARRS